MQDRDVGRPQRTRPARPRGEHVPTTPRRRTRQAACRHPQRKPGRPPRGRGRAGATAAATRHAWPTGTAPPPRPSTKSKSKTATCPHPPTRRRPETEPRPRPPRGAVDRPRRLRARSRGARRAGSTARPAGARGTRDAVDELCAYGRAGADPRVDGAGCACGSRTMVRARSCETVKGTHDHARGVPKRTTMCSCESHVTTEPSGEWRRPGRSRRPRRVPPPVPACRDETRIRERARRHTRRTHRHRPPGPYDRRARRRYRPIDVKDL